LKTEDWWTWTPLKTRGELRWNRGVISPCSTSGNLLLFLAHLTQRIMLAIAITWCTSSVFSINLTVSKTKIMYS
jgi:hypothetical protein